MTEISQATTDAEEALLGAILIESAYSGNRKAIDAVSNIVSTHDFLGYYGKYPMPRQPQVVRIYHAMLKADNPPHQIEVARTMSRLGILQTDDCSYLCHLVAMCPCSLDYLSYAEAVKEYSSMRWGERRPIFTGGI